MRPSALLPSGAFFWSAMSDPLKPAPMSRSLESDFPIQYWIDSEIEPKKCAFWDDMRRQLHRTQEMALTIERDPGSVTPEELASFTAKSIRTNAIFNAAWHAEMLDQRRCILSMMAENKYRLQQVFRDECAWMVGESTVWREYSLWLRAQPGWREMNAEDHQREYTRLQQEYVAEMDPIKKELRTKLRQEHEEREGITLEEIMEAVRSTPTMDEDARENAVKVMDYCLTMGLAIPSTWEPEDFQDA